MKDLLEALPPGLLLPVAALLLVLEAGTLLPGMLIPGTAVLLALGFFAQSGFVTLAAALTAAILGAVVGAQFGYGNGRRWRRRSAPPVIPPIIAAGWARAGGFVERHGVPAVAAGQWLFAARALTPRLAGWSGVGYPAFSLANTPSAVVWAATLTTGGYVLGAQAQQLFANGVNIAAAVLVVAAFAALHLYRRARRPAASAPNTEPAPEPAAEPAEP
ncbi:membrane-associated protein [Murinocardiopsis flavida]|uniref:Membrane-associated protein n=1 Tax=Murinocardiopsis flavida TaxID=645275 RepID=A0A2P8DDZ8_9ACTN|nr:VTT domain-containing protein [Murinocardiopsis flavida]PSK95453.1 membrane-associated protein [Murinocardiopsis flavida]